MPEPPVYEDEINLLDYWQVLVKRKRFLFWVVGSAFAVSIAVSLLLPKIYEAKTSLLPPQEGASGPSFISQLPGGLGGLAGGLLGGKSAADLWVGILKSRTVSDEIVARFQLKEVYHQETDEAARRELQSALRINKSKEEIISITVADRVPARAAEIANAFVDSLDRINREIGMTSGGRMRTFVEKRLEEAKTTLTQAEEALKTFQEKNGAIKLDAQSTAIIGAIGEIKGILMAKEVALETLLSYATPQNPQVRILKTEVRELQRALNKLEEGSQEKVSSKSIFIPTVNLPGLGLRYARLLRAVKTHETLFGLLTEQYEIARIQEAKDSSTVQVLDVAVIPERRAKPKRTLIVILSTFTAAFVGIFLAFFLEYLEKAQSAKKATP